MQPRLMTVSQPVPVRSLPANARSRAPISAFVLMLALVVPALATPGCSDQGEGERCTLFTGGDAGENGSSECASGLVCTANSYYTPVTGTQGTGTLGVCCPPSGVKATTAACSPSSGGSTTTGFDSGGPEGGSETGATDAATDAATDSANDGGHDAGTSFDGASDAASDGTGAADTATDAAADSTADSTVDASNDAASDASAG